MITSPEDGHIVSAIFFQKAIAVSFIMSPKQLNSAAFYLIIYLRACVEQSEEVSAYACTRYQILRSDFQLKPSIPPESTNWF